MIGIYKILSPSGKIYIGQSVDINRRLNEYLNLQNCKQQIKLYNSFQKYSIENHKFEIIEECTLEQLNERERYYQDYYNTIGKNGLNCKLTGTNDKSGLLSDDIKNKISKSSKGKVFSIESRQKMSKSSKGKPKPKGFGINSKETKLRKSISAMGRLRSDKTKQKISKSMSKPILQYDKKMNFIKEWNSSDEVTKELKIQPCLVLKEKGKTAGGFIWKYKQTL
jgi:group I intron endonuclease